VSGASIEPAPPPPPSAIVGSMMHIIVTRAVPQALVLALPFIYALCAPLGSKGSSFGTMLLASVVQALLGSGGIVPGTCLWDTRYLRQHHLPWSFLLIGAMMTLSFGSHIIAFSAEAPPVVCVALELFMLAFFVDVVYNISFWRFYLPRKWQALFAAVTGALDTNAYAVTLPVFLYINLVILPNTGYSYLLSLAAFVEKLILKCLAGGVVQTAGPLALATNFSVMIHFYLDNAILGAMAFASAPDVIQFSMLALGDVAVYAWQILQIKMMCDREVTVKVWAGTKPVVSALKKRMAWASNTAFVSLEPQAAFDFKLHVLVAHSTSLEGLCQTTSLLALVIGFGILSLPTESASSMKLALFPDGMQSLIFVLCFLPVTIMQDFFVHWYAAQKGMNLKKMWKVHGENLTFDAAVMAWGTCWVLLSVVVLLAPRHAS